MAGTENDFFVVINIIVIAFRRRGEDLARSSLPWATAATAAAAAAPGLTAPSGPLQAA